MVVFVKKVVRDLQRLLVVQYPLKEAPVAISMISSCQSLKTLLNETSPLALRKNHPIATVPQLAANSIQRPQCSDNTYFH